MTRWRESLTAIDVNYEALSDKSDTVGDDTLVKFGLDLCEVFAIIKEDQDSIGSLEQKDYVEEMGGGGRRRK